MSNNNEKKQLLKIIPSAHIIMKELEHGFILDKYVIISENDIDEALLNIMFNPETSGGLLITVPKNELDEILDKLKDIPTRFAVIGKVVEKKEKYLIVK